MGTPTTALSIPLQTYECQQDSMPDIVEWYELSPAVHDVRSNILTAVAWASRHGWGPWGAHDIDQDPQQKGDLSGPAASSCGSPSW